MDSSSANAMNILQQFSQLLFLQSLTSGNTSMNPSVFGFPNLKQEEQQQIPSSSPAQMTTLPPISPQGDASNHLQTISDLLSSHQTLKSEFSPAFPSETSPFKMYNNDYGFDFPSPLSSSTARQYKVHVNRESSKPLQEWMNHHLTNPYPTHRDVQQLSQQTGFTFKQVRNWFTNSRRRFEQQCGTNSLPWIKKEAPKVFRKSDSPGASSSSSSEVCPSL